MTHGRNGRVKTRAPRQKLQARRTGGAERSLSPARAFVVQFREETGGAGERFTGRAEHMITGHTARFESAEELLAFFVRVLSAVPAKLSEEG
jgi:hypothetical protein